MDDDPESVANENYVSAFIEMSRELDQGSVQQFDTITATCSGLPSEPYNRLFVLQAPLPDEFSAAIDWQRDRGEPYWITTTEQTSDIIEQQLADHGFEHVQSQPGMLLEPLDTVPDPVSPAEIGIVRDRDGFDALVDAFAGAFEVSRELTRQAYSMSFLDHDELELFVGHVDDTPVACGLLFQRDRQAGVYSIGVVDEYRRQGIGRDMTWAVLETGAKAGCTVGVLQSSEMGRPLYERIGFETAVTYHQFGRPH